jgi:hypothetical protein
VLKCSHSSGEFTDTSLLGSRFQNKLPAAPQASHWHSSRFRSSPHHHARTSNRGAVEEELEGGIGIPASALLLLRPIRDLGVDWKEVPRISPSRAGTMASWKASWKELHHDGDGGRDRTRSLNCTFPTHSPSPQWLLSSPRFMHCYLCNQTPLAAAQSAWRATSGLWLLLLASPLRSLSPFQYLADIAFQPILTRHTTRSGAARGERDGATEPTEREHVNPPLHCASPGSPRCFPGEHATSAMSQSAGMPNG